MNGADEQQVSQISEVLEEFKTFEHFSKCLLDAFAVVDSKGKIHKCNSLFGTICGVKPKQAMKEDSIATLLQLKISDRFLKLEELLATPSPARFDEVDAEAPKQVDIKLRHLRLIIGLYPFFRNGTPIGAFLLIRDVTAEANLHGKYKQKAADSITDGLTGLFNRGHFNTSVKTQVATMKTYPEEAPQRVLSVVIIDLDFFKKINDGYGHAAGDFVLTSTADLMRKAFRKTDYVYRYGGEEFVAVLPGTDLAGAVVAADKLRQMIHAHRYEFEGKVLPVTMSSGVAQVALDKESADDALARADKALYHAKESGRNRVCIHDGDKVAAPQGAAGNPRAA